LAVGSVRDQARIETRIERCALTYRDEGPASPEKDGSWNAAIFVGLLLVAAVVFTLYFLLWDGGGNT
jgi:hypothetical protein